VTTTAAASRATSTETAARRAIGARR
jgi:hypothetical protein